MLILLSFLALLRVFLLAGFLTWLWLIPLGLVLSRTLHASSGGRIVWVLVETLLSCVLMLWLRPLLALSLTGGSLLIFQ